MAVSNVFVFFCLAALKEVSASGVRDAECDPDDGTCHSKSSALLQHRVQQNSIEQASTDLELKPHVYGPIEMEGNMMEYFKSWSQGRVRSHMNSMLDIEAGHLESDPSLDDETEDSNEKDNDENEDENDEDLDEDHAPMKELVEKSESEALSSEDMTELLKQTRQEQCEKLEGEKAARQGPFDLITAEEEDEQGVRHVLLKDQNGRLQYLAIHKPSVKGNHRVIVADPPACQLLLEDETDPLPGAARDQTGAPKMLSIKDRAVKDCKKLLEKSFKENCQSEIEVMPKSASTGVVDGLAVNMEAEVCQGKVCHMHHPLCLFETSRNHTDASLLEVTRVSRHDPLKDLKGTVELAVPICDAASKASMEPHAAAIARESLSFAMGENSRYKGFEHVLDNLPVYSALELEGETPSAVDLRSKFPMCFPKLGGSKHQYTEVVRDQGSCGSCWAFAGASLTANNLCISGSGKNMFNKPKDRAEVSVQKIISCKPQGKNQQDGCEGGNMGSFDAGASKWGLTKEKDNLYKCGGGNPKNHFEQKTGGCKKFPWGGQCTGKAQSDWHWGGAVRISGEEDMMSYVANGYTLYASLDVYANFMNHKTGVYRKKSGTKKGGHAVVVVGYGKESGHKYWILQNSWGSKSWGVGGYGKILRGKNLCGIEDVATVARAWVKGGKEPPCMDSPIGTKLSSTGYAPYIPCSQAKGGRYGDLCSQYAVVREYCPKTCFGKCPTSSPSPAPASPSPAPPPAETTTTTTTTTKPPPTPGCKDQATDVSPIIRLNGVPSSCKRLGRFCKYSFVKSKCQKTCGVCGSKKGTAKGKKVCKDSKTYKDPYFGDSCAAWAGFKCKGFKFSKALIKHCPKACGKCR
eukprot:TRINITY_DN434_c0_g1_i2.p1 TRINITY_DN434_c0_g1~~TRINITY_DN434_c0_g1_i2.p1  ORF type:complete len:860 (-),score=204.77 TRINITY_DN434_c0_g1_i2:141-2720(-)